MKDCMRRLRGVEQSGDQEGRGNDREGVLLAGEDDEDPLQQDYAPEVDRDQRGVAIVSGIM
jgi:hypothetical protein